MAFGSHLNFPPCVQNHNIVSVGLLLGIAAAHLGSMDMSATRLLAVHWPALLPPSNSELEVSHNVQVAAVVGVGLVYQGTAHRHITETLLREIGTMYINVHVCSSKNIA